MSYYGYYLYRARFVKLIILAVEGGTVRDTTVQNTQRIRGPKVREGKGFFNKNLLNKVCT